MMDNKQKEKILENVKLKISISNFEKEEKKTRNLKEKFILKNIGIAACVLISMTGVVVAGNKIVEKIEQIEERKEIEKVWETPEKIENITDEITEESKKENITEEQAKEIAINKLKAIGFNTNIIDAIHHKDLTSNLIIYNFLNEEYCTIEIEGKTGKVTTISNNFYENIYNFSDTITVNEAKEIATKYYKLLGFKEGEYEITSPSSDYMDKKINVVFTKKYGETYNPFENINICIEPAVSKDVSYISIQSTPFDNNEIIITKDEAIQIALSEDEKIETDKCVEVNAETMIVIMNTSAYERITDKEKYYKEMTGCFWKDRTYYKIKNKARNAWVVLITYDIYYNREGKKRPNECQYSYFVDCTTGEIIGGYPGDYKEGKN